MRAYHETYGLYTTVTNCSNNYGPYQFPEKLIPLIIMNILSGDPLPVYGDGLQVRDWLHVADHCEAISLAIARGQSGEIYNIGGNSETTNIEIVRTLCTLVDETLGEREDLRKAFPSAASGERQAGERTHRARARSARTRSALCDQFFQGTAGNWLRAGARPRRGLRATLDWYLDNTRWWQALLGRDYAAWVEKNYSR